MRNNTRLSLYKNSRSLLRNSVLYNRFGWVSRQTTVLHISVECYIKYIDVLKIFIVPQSLLLKTVIT